jgi:hypothetical protein
VRLSLQKHMYAMVELGSLAGDLIQYQVCSLRQLGRSALS